MATKPTASNSAFATDTNFSAGSAIGTPVKVAPTSIVAQGWRPDDALGFVGAWFNYLQNQAYLWFVYLDDLHNSADFLNKSYTWLTGVHRFTSGLRSAGLKLESGDLTYTDSSGTAAPRSRVKMVKLNVSNGWTRSEEILEGTNTAGYFDLDLPSGAVLTEVHAWCQDDGAGSAVSLRIIRNFRLTTTGFTENQEIGTFDQTDSDGVLTEISVTDLSQVIDNVSYTYDAQITTLGGALPSKINMIYAYYTDPGFLGNI